MSNQINKQINKTRGAVLYTRVSTEEQIKNTSLASQLEACINKAEALNLPIVSSHSDPGVSGARYQSRPGVQDAIKDIEAGRADTLICLDLDRLSRVVQHQLEIKERVEKAGGKLIFCTQDFADDEEGELQYTMTGTFKAHEKAVFRRRTMNGRRRAAKEGRQSARGWSPYGYTIPKTKDIIKGLYPPEQVGKYLINEKEAETIRWLFTEYAAGNYSLPGLARELNRRQVPTKQGATQWHPPTIRGFFTNSVYIGQPKYGKLTCRKDENQLTQIRPSTGEFYKTQEVRKPSPSESILTLSAPSLIDEATWNAVQERLTTNKARRGGNPCRTHLLSGTCKCEECNAPMQMNSGNSEKGHPSYYACGKFRQARSYTGERVCSSTHYKVPVVEGAVIKSIEEAAEHPEWIAIAIDNHLKKRPVRPQEDARREITAVTKALNELEQEESAAVAAQIAGIRAGASPAAYAAVFADIAARRKDMEDRRGVLSRTLVSQHRETAGGISKEEVLGDRYSGTFTRL